MKKNAHVLLLLAGLIAATLATIRLLAMDPGASLRQLQKEPGLMLLGLTFSPFVVLAVLVQLGRVFHWRAAVGRAWMVTDGLVTLVSGGIYGLAAWAGRGGSDMAPLLLILVALYSWGAIPVVWIAAWLVCRARQARREASGENSVEPAGGKR